MRILTLFAVSIFLGACAADPVATHGASSGGVPNTPTGSSSTKESPSSGTTSDPSDSSNASKPEPANPPGPTPGLDVSVHTTLGIPEAASPDDPQHALLVKPQYVVSFDGTRKNPRWTSWELTNAWLGAASRSLDFSADPALPAAIPQATSSDYVKSGFSRGHLCPSADRTDNATDNLATFAFTNAVPQTAQSNTGPWEDLEREERVLATAGHHLFIVAGSRYETAQTIGNDVAVPTSMFKVVVVMDGAHPVPSEVTSSTRVIAVDIPNTTSVRGAYTDHLTSFGQLEAETGLRFMADVSDAMHDVLAKKIDGTPN